MELENIVANTVYLKAREGKWISITSCFIFYFIILKEGWPDVKTSEDEGGILWRSYGRHQPCRENV